MKFVCLGFFDEEKWAQMPADEQERRIEECFTFDDELRAGGHFLDGEALGGKDSAVTLTLNGGRVEVIEGPYSETKELLGGIMLLEANDLNHAISLISRHPGLHMGPFEIRASDVNMNEHIKGRNRQHLTRQEADSLPKIAIQRLLHGSPARAKRYWLEEEHLRQWWGPRTNGVDWTCPEAELHPEVGGSLRMCICSPQGERIWASGHYTILEDTHLAFRIAWESDSDLSTISKTIAVDFEPAGENTRVLVHISGYPNESSRDSEIEGWNDCIDRFVRYCEQR